MEFAFFLFLLGRIMIMVVIVISLLVICVAFLSLVVFQIDDIDCNVDLGDSLMSSFGRLLSAANIPLNYLNYGARWGDLASTPFDFIAGVLCAASTTLVTKRVIQVQIARQIGFSFFLYAWQSSIYDWGSLKYPIKDGNCYAEN